MNAGLADAGLKARFADLGGTPLAGGSGTIIGGLIGAVALIVAMGIGVAR